jgi:hypothetical protein
VGLDVRRNTEPGALISPGVPSQLETLLPGHRKGHPGRLGRAVGPSTVELLMPLASTGVAAITSPSAPAAGRTECALVLVCQTGPAGPYGNLCTSSGRVAPLSVASPSRLGRRTLLSPAVSSPSGREGG